MVISEFQTASAANAAPDLQFLWNGIYHMESVWFGYLEPLNNLLDDAFLANTNATPLSIYQGQQYRTGWYSVPLLWVYNKILFDKAGLDADNPPKTWDEFMAANESLLAPASRPSPPVSRTDPGASGTWATRPARTSTRPRTR